MHIVVLNLLVTLCSAGCGWWLLLIYCERKLLLAGWWLVPMLFGVREKYCWLVLEQPAEQRKCSRKL